MYRDGGDGAVFFELDFEVEGFAAGCEVHPQLRVYGERLPGIWESASFGAVEGWGLR